MGIKGASRLLLLGILGCFNALASSAQATTDEGTRVSQALSQQADVLFIQRYLTLTPDERSEVKDVLTTPFKSWDVIDQIADIFLQDPGSQTHSLKWALKNWIEENPLPEDDTYSHLRFVGLKNSPSSVKILFEKGVCIHDENDSKSLTHIPNPIGCKIKENFPTAYKVTLASFVIEGLFHKDPCASREVALKKLAAERAKRPKITKDILASKPADAGESCVRDLKIAVVTDPGTTVLSEKLIEQSNTRDFVRKFNEANFKTLRDSIWLAYVQSASSVEKAAIVRQLQVINMFANFGAKELFERRQALVKWIDQGRQPGSIRPEDVGTREQCPVLRSFYKHHRMIPRVHEDRSCYFLDKSSN